MNISLESVATEFARRKELLSRIVAVVGPTSYRELGAAEGANVATVRSALRDGVTDNHDRGAPRRSPPRDELLRSISKTMAPLTTAELSRRLRALADTLDV